MNVSVEETITYTIKLSEEENRDLIRILQDYIGHICKDNIMLNVAEGFLEGLFDE